MRQIGLKTTTGGVNSFSEMYKASTRIKKDKKVKLEEHLPKRKKIRSIKSVSVVEPRGDPKTDYLSTGTDLGSAGP